MKFGNFGDDLIWIGHNLFGTATRYGSFLIKVGQTEKKLGLLMEEDNNGEDNALVNFICLIFFILIHLVVVALSVFCLLCLYFCSTKATDTATPQYRGLPWMTKVKHLDQNCNSRKQACRKSRERPFPEQGLNHVFKASNDDFEMVIRNGNQCFQSRDMLPFWKCKYFDYPNEQWTCAEDGMMMAVFDMNGHFLYKESIQATRDKRRSWLMVK